MSLLENDITRKGQVDEITSQLNFEANNQGKKYEVERIGDSIVYARESIRDHLLKLYYLFF